MKKEYTNTQYQRSFNEKGNTIATDYTMSHKDIRSQSSEFVNITLLGKTSLYRLRISRLGNYTY